MPVAWPCQRVAPAGSRRAQSRQQSPPSPNSPLFPHVATTASLPGSNCCFEILPGGGNLRTRCCQTNRAVSGRVNGRRVLNGILRAAQRTSALVPMINRRRKARSPLFEVFPSFSLPPVDRCRGVSESSPYCAAALRSADQSSFSSDHHRTDSDATDIGPTPGCAPFAELDCLQHYAIARSSTIFADETGENGRHQDCAS